MWEQENRVLYGDFAGVIEGNADVAGYSGAPLAKKLGLKAGNRIAVIGAPLSFLETLGEIPPDVSISTDLRCRGAFDLILFFAPDLTSLRRFARLAERLTPAGGLWVAWPKKASGVTTDLTDGAVRAFGLNAGLVDNKVCAVDETWSGLRFVYRLIDRPARPT